MTSHFASDETRPDHQHHRLMGAALVVFPALILASALSSLFAMG
jgi:hypothetical protein